MLNISKKIMEIGRFRMKLLNLIFVLLIISHFAFSQSSNTGVLTGKLIDQQTGESLRSGTIYLVGTKKGTYSDVKGEFRIRDIAPGTYSIRVSYIGYNPKEITGIAINAGGNLNLGNILLESSIKQTEEIVVEAQRSKDNEAAILSIRKNAIQVSDGISQEEIKRLPGSDAGQSLKRVSGVTLVNDKFVFVRGVSERYSNTVLNGTALATTEPDKKAFAFDIFPSDFLESVNISKSFTPDLPGNFAGGLVQLKTVDFPEGFLFKVSLGSSANTNVTLIENAFFSYSGGENNWLGLDDGSRKLPESIPSNRRDLNDLLRRANDPFDETGAAEEYEKMMRSFNSKNWERIPKTIGLLDNRSIGLSLTNKFQLFENDFGLSASVNYRNSYSLSNLIRNGYLASFDTLFYSSGTKATSSVNWGGLLNFAYKISDHTSLNFKNVFNVSTDDDIIELAGQDVGYQYLDYRNYAYQYLQKTLFSTQLGGEHTLKFLSKSLLDWSLGYSISERDEPDLRRLRFARQLAYIIDDPDFPYTPEILVTQQGDGTRAGRFYSALNDRVDNAIVNLLIPFESFKIKTGFLYEKRDRSFNARSLTITRPYELAPEIEVLLHDYKHPERIFASENFRIKDGFRIAEDSRLSDSYEADEDLIATYLMVDYLFTLFGIDFRFIGGARFESSVQKLNSHLINDQPVEINRQSDDWLPSFNLITKITNISNLRFSAGQTLARPSLREFAPFAFYDYLQASLIQGNPNLVRALIQNYDIRYELFPNPGEVVSFSLFYKTFTNAIEETIFPQQSELTRTFANAEGTALNYGLEVEVRKNLGFISPILSNFAFNINLALIYSDLRVLQGGEGTDDHRPMWGQSPYTVNVGLFYRHPDWNTSVNIGYNTYGKKIIQVAQQGIYQNVSDPHIYEMPRDIIDLSIIQPFTNGLEVKLAVKDLLNQALVWKQSDKLTLSNINGTTISLGMSYILK